MKKSYKTRGQGFTLIELLAVLVVLAILALIAIPIVIKVINNAREDSHKRSIEGYARAVEMGLARWAMANPGVEFPGYISKIVDEEENTLIDYKGDQVSCDNKIEYDKDTNQVKLTGCHVLKANGDFKSESYDYDGNEVRPSSSTSYEEYKVGDTFNFSGSTYYVIAESGIDNVSVTALKDKPLTATEITDFGFEIQNETNSYGYVVYDKTNNTNNYAKSDVKKIVDKWAESLQLTVEEARLIKYEELVNNLGYDNATWTASWWEVNPVSTPSWVYSSEYNYWTMSQYQDSDSGIWGLGRNGAGNIGYYDKSGGIAIRPVITVDKSKVTKN